MPRYKLTIEYDGSAYKGWQRQNDQPSIQEALEKAIEGFVRYPVAVFGAGRTDAGVHAIAQVAHLDLRDEWDPFKICNAANAHLKDSGIVVFKAEEVAEDFNARFSAIARHYVYKIITRRAPLTIHAGRAWNVKVPLDVEAMHEAAQCLVGRHDFTTFRSTKCQAKSPVKTLTSLDVSFVDKVDGQHIEICAFAPSFLHNQIRSFTGSLKRVGEGRWSKGDLAGALEACERKRCGPVAPPQGLYLEKVDY
jgi:tRNA pseudouridine38-40 synthase